MASHVISDNRVDEFHRRIANYVRVLNPIVLLELSQGFSLSGGEERFQLDRLKVEIAFGRHGYETVTFPFLFAVSRAGGSFSPPPILPLGLELWLRGIVDAKSLRELMDGRVNVKLYGEEHFCGVRPKMAKEVMDSYKLRYNAMREAVRNGQVLPPIEEWIAQLATHGKANIGQSQIEMLKQELMLSYAFVSERLSPSNLNSSDNESSDGDWADCLLLMYLSDPEMIMLTNDKRIKNILCNHRNSEVRCKAERQIVRYKDFMSQVL